MSISWEQFKKNKQKEFNLIPAVIIPARLRYETPAEPIVKRFNIHKRSLPPGIDEIIVFNVTEAEAAWWINYKLKAKCYQDDAAKSKTVIYYDVIPVDAKPRERSIYFNPRPVTMSEGEKYFEDKQPYPDEVPFVD